MFRHIPTKAALVEAALIRHFDLLNERASTLADRADSGQAFRDLLRTMVEGGSTKLTLASQMPDGQFPPSVRQAADKLRATVEEVYLLVRGLAQASATTPTTPQTISRAIDVVIAGLSA